MAERQGSSPEEQKQSANVHKEDESIVTIAHDVKDRITSSTSGVDFVQMMLAEEPVLRNRDAIADVLNVTKGELSRAQRLIEDAKKNAPWEEKELRAVHSMIKLELQKICSTNIAGRKCIIEECDSPEVKHTGITPAPDSPLRVILHPLPDGIRRYNIRMEAVGIERIFENLIKNASRKGADEIHIHIAEISKNNIAISVSDDGEGMKLALLDNLRKGGSGTDKSGSDIEDGGTSADHGHGLKSVRQLVEKKGRGSMEIYSVKKRSLHDSGGFDIQDEESMKVHPLPQGVTVRFVFHVDRMGVNGGTKIEPERDVSDQAMRETASQVDTVQELAAIKTPEQAHQSRRETLGILAIAAGVGVLGATLSMRSNKTKNEIANTLTNPASPISPLSNFYFDSNNQLLSFECRMGERNMTWERGGKLPPGVVDIRPLPFGDSSVTAITLSTSDERVHQTTIMVGTPMGTFASVKVPVGNTWKTAFAVGPRSPKFLEPQLLQDTVVHYDARQNKEKPVFVATNMKMFDSPRLKAIVPFLEKIAPEIDRSAGIGGSAFDNVGATLATVASFHQSFQDHDHLAAVNDRDVLKRMIEEEEGERFIIADPMLIDELRTNNIVLSKERIMKDKKRVCLQNVWPNEAVHMIKMA